MDAKFHPGDRVDVVGGVFANFQGGIVVECDGQVATVTFNIFGRVAGPVAIPVECLRLVGGDDEPR